MADSPDDKSSAGGAALERINATVIGGVLAVALAGGLGLAYFLNWLSDGLVGLLIAVAFAVVLALIVLRAAFDTVRPALRIGLFAFVLALAAVAIYPATVALHLGRPAASATLTEDERTLTLPSEGAYHLLVSGRLREGAEARITYRLKTGAEVVDCALERQYQTRRARRGASIQVPEDHDVAGHDVRVAGSPATVSLDSISGGRPLKVQAFPMLPLPAIWAAMALLVLAGMLLEAKAPANGSIVMSGVAAACFGLIVRTASPGAMAWPTLWGALLALGGGAVGGSILGAVGRRLFGPPPEAGRPGGGRGDADEEDEEAKPRAKERRAG